MKVGVIFSGQGAQFPGMGSKYYNEYESSRRIFDLAGEDIKDKCFNGSNEVLRETKNTQPTVFTTQMAAWAALKEVLETNSEVADLLQISAVAGFSLGEYGAYTAAGVFPDFPTGLDLVTHRGIFMSEAGQYEDGSPRGGMVAILGERKKVLEAVQSVQGDDVLEAVNYNAPTQTAVAGDIEALDRLKAVAKDFGIKAIPLNVSTAFHSSIMTKASDLLLDYVKDMEFSEPQYTLYSNITGRDVMESKEGNVSFSEHIKDRISTQVKSPVFWQETIENMKADGVDVFVETGPGKTLLGLVKKTLPGTDVFCISDPEGLESLIEFCKNK